MARAKFSELRDAVVAKPGAAERLAGLRAETLEEIRLYELRHGEAISQASSPVDSTSPRERSPSSSTPTTCECRRCVSTSKRSVPAWSSSPCSTTRIVGCPSTSAATTRPDRRCQQRVSTTCAHQCRRAWWRRAYNTRTTRRAQRAPTTPTTWPRAGLDSLAHQAERR
jgi:hypothetical protein